MATVVDIIAVMKILTTCKEAYKSRGLCERLQGSIDEVTQLIQSQQSKLNYIVDQLRERYCVDMTEVTWYFTSLCLCLLEALKNCLDQLSVTDSTLPSWKLQYPELPPNILSIQQQKIVQAMGQFIVMLGLSPYLLSGVGVPLRQRTKSPDALATLKQLQQADHMTNQQRAWHLYKCCSVLVQCSDQPSLRASIFPTYLIDVISALLQICYGPLDNCDVLPSDRLPSNTKFASPADIKPVMVTNDNHIACISEGQRERSSEIMELLLDKMYPPLVISQLLTLHSIARTTTDKCEWTVKGCGRLLSQRLMKPHGVQALIEATFSNVRGIGDSEHSWKKAQAVAKIVARCPSQITSLMEYYKIVSPQVVALLKQDNGGHYVQLLVAIINAMISENESIAVQFIIEPLASPLCSVANGDLCCHGDQLFQTFKILHQVVTMAPLSSPVLAQLLPYLPVLVRVVIATEEITSKQLQTLNVNSKQIIVVLLKSMEDDQCRHFIQSIIYGPVPDQYIKIDNDVTLHYQDGIIATTNERRMDSSLMEQMNTFLQHLLQELNDRVLEAEVFLNCFHQLSNNLLQLSSTTPSDKQYENSLILFIVTDMCEHKADQLLAQLGVTKMLTLSSQLLHSHCVAMEKHHISFHDSHSNDLDNQIFGGQITMSIALGIVTMVMTNCQKDSSGSNIDKQLISTVLSLLKKISENYPVEELRTMAAELSICLATLGAVKGDLSPRQPTSSHKPLIEEINKQDVTSESKTNSEADTPFQHALKEVQDILLPVRGHGVQMLSNLVRSKDPETVENVSKLMVIFQEQLRSSDSYVYLRAINGLAALACVKPDDVIPLLCREFIDLASDKERSQKVATSCHADDEGSCDTGISVTLKVGEVLVKVAKECNEMLPHYSNQFLTAIMNGVKCSDPLVQASSLSGLATVCEHLGYSLATVQHEVLKCVHDALVASGNQQVERAAIQTLHLILKGLGHRCIEVLGDSLHDVYQLLKRVAIASHDPTTTEHANAAVDQLNNVMKQSLFSHDPNNVTKNISVIHK